ncbi:C-Jun-amino-terminal kinase-interacting protein 4-like isoform X8 [Octopus vulgaris]|uniref:C-Jun-amino-terminal kinase-interacting protein 4-like isoform X8 n=1 Tax=Octopus vulgaris TaxID=6645 RepID=A0AA36BJ35_OCTVU|nr:C-Jun-amino-terminal kinase-interacting protein 4-like isoform X8 [Octopus vulgaris]
MDPDMGETVYGTQEEGHVMSEKVQTLAASVYKEFERMIKKYDEDVVKELMPLVVGILESLDNAFSDKQQIEVELELLRDDNEQLLTQYEREKQLRKAAEQKFFEVEDAIEGEKKELQDKVESLESIVRMLELKAKNSADHVSRLEDKEAEMKKEYSKLHERYTELFRTHMDYMERAKIVMGTDRLADLANSPRVKSGFQLPNLRPVNVNIYGGAGDTPTKSENSPVGFDVTSPGRPHSSNTSLKSELSDAESPEKISNRLSKSIEVECKTQTTEKSQVTDAIDVRESGTATILDRTPNAIIPNTPELDEPAEALSQANAANKKNVKINNESIYNEFAMQDSDLIGDVDFGADITGSAVNPGEYASSVSDNFFGMGKELENLILENTELLATKNALNVVKDDLIAKVDELTSEHEIMREEINSLQTVKSRQIQRISELEDNLKKVKEELEKKSQVAQADEEDDIPMAQRKRFTRVEMARVLMERNQYKERLMELQEAVRWTEMIRASREHPDLAPTKKKSSIWNFFSNLFNTSNKPSKKPLPVATVRYNAPTTHVQPVGDPNKKQRSKYNLGEKAKAYEFLQDEGVSEKTKKEKERERWEQYKQVRVHVKKDDGRMHAYGWSLPAKSQPTIPREIHNKSHVPVPVPIYCRPLLEKEPGLKIWCAAGVNLTGGRTKDGGSIVGASVFYSNPPSEELEKKKETKDEIEKLNEELKEHEKNLKQTEKEQMSSFVWICTSTQPSSRVTVIDANNPGDILETFKVTSSHILCIASVPGAMESDYPVEEDILKADASSPHTNPPSSPGGSGSTNSDSGIGGITFVQCATGAASRTTSKSSSPTDSPALRESSPDGRSSLETVKEAVKTLKEKVDDTKEGDDIPEDRGNPEGSESVDAQGSLIKATGSPASSGTTTPTSSPSLGLEKRLLQEPTELVKDGISTLPTDNDLQYEEVEKMSSVLPTMWLGSQSGNLYVHSSVSQWKRCLHSVKLPDSVLNIVHTKGRVLVALADGSVAIFHRASDGQWDLKNYHLLDLGKPTHSIRCMVLVANKLVWCGCKNSIHVVDPQNMKVVKSFDAHPRKESQVRQLAWVGDGVWVSIRLDSTLRLYHAYTYQHLQDVDIEPYVSKMLGTGKLGFSFVRITSLLISCNRLWIGTGNGVIISVPLSESSFSTASYSHQVCWKLLGNKQPVSTGSHPNRPGNVIRVYSDSKGDNITPGTFIPYCSMAQAQLSFHGHRDAVKFFVAVPGSPVKGISAASVDSEGTNKNVREATPVVHSLAKLVISGGEGYIDFRTGDGEEDDSNQDEAKKSCLNRGERSHLIVWQVTCPD